MPTALKVFLAVSIAIFVSACDRNSGVATVTDSVKANSLQVAAANEGATSRRYPGDADELQQVGLSPKRGEMEGYVGADQCGSCHQEAFQDWEQSHHDLAMKTPSASTVVGDFENAKFDYFGIESTFFKRDDAFFVVTDGEDGKLEEFPIAYTFGVYPLQQYLVELPGGRLQALSISWDSRSKEDGGQRWFHLYPDDPIRAGDPLHWTGIHQNWNFQCADCHSTSLHKNYNPEFKSFTTEWAEMNVGCEACHGPGAQHVEWASLDAVGRATSKDNGLDISFADRHKVRWEMDFDSGIAKLGQDFHVETIRDQVQQEIPVCAQCHSRRGTQFPGYKPGRKFLDFFHPALLNEDLYHADGQINDEVYVWGSFQQSKMYAAGVTCSNCHNPHSLELRADTDSICAQCHLPSKFDTPEHHLHPVGSQGAQCVNCHMPSKTYMQVDVRRDHSFRIPRPDLSEKIGSPNACQACHIDETNEWARKILEEKFGAPEDHYGETLYAGRVGAPDAESLLMKLAGDTSQPAIVRATATSLLPRYISPASARLLQVIAQGNDSLTQLALAQSLDQLPVQVRPAMAIPLLYEDERVARSLAANAMVGVPLDSYPGEVTRLQDEALDDYVRAAMFNGDRPESLINLALLRSREGDAVAAEQLLKDATAIAPYYTPAIINLADLYRSGGREAESEALLRSAIPKALDKAPIQYALGLSLVRQKRVDEAEKMLRAAAQSDSATPQFIYVYGIALNSQGKANHAIQELERGLTKFPGDRQILTALISLNREQGNEENANKYSRQLTE